MKPIYLVVGAVLLVLACGSSQEVISTAVAGTQIALAQTQTAAIPPTNTLTATNTATLTATNTTTNTATVTPTNSPTATTPPETLTAIAQATEQAVATLNAGATRTEAAAAITATRQQYVSNITGTAEAIGATRTEQAGQRTATAVAVESTKTFLAQYKAIDYRELSAYADAHIGEKIYISGRVFNIIDSQSLQIWMGNSDDAAVVSTTKKFGGIYENDRITVYGVVAGFYEGTNSFGGTIKQPLIKDAFFEAPPPAPPKPTPTPLPGGATLISCDPSGGYANVGNVQSFFIESHDGRLTAGNGATGQYMYSFQRAIYYAIDGSGPYVFCTGRDW